MTAGDGATDADDDNADDAVVMPMTMTTIVRDAGVRGRQTVEQVSSARVATTEETWWSREENAGCSAVCDRRRQH